MKIPRKKKKKIPRDTFYCYDNRGVCPFYSHIEGIEGLCSLMTCGVDDQVKECGISYPKL